jgi:Major Facilitator Superfamily
VLSAFASPKLRRIVAAYTINRLGTWFGFIALSLAVFDQTHSAIAVAAVLIAAQVVPALVAPALVARVETSTRNRFSELYFFEAAATAALAVLLLSHFWLPVILLLAALDGTAALAANALLRAETARAARATVESQGNGQVRPDGSLEQEAEEAERKANAALNVAFSFTFVFGPALAGGIVAAASASAAMFIDAGSFLICGAMLVDLRAAETSPDVSVRARLAQAWEHIRGMPMLRGLLLAEAAALIFFESAAPIEVAYAKTTLNAGDRGYGALVGAWGLGAVVGSVIFARSTRRPLGAMLAAAVFAIGLAYLGFSIAPSLAVACAAAALGGVGNGVEWASVISIVQRLTPQKLHGQLMGAVESLGAICPAIGLSLGGALVALSSPRVAFLVVGAASTAMTIPFLLLYLKGLDVRSAADTAAQELELPARPVPEVVP